MVPYGLSFFILRFFVFYKHFKKYEYSEYLFSLYVICFLYICYLYIFIMWRYCFNRQYFGVSNIRIVPCTTRRKTKITTPSGEDLRRLHPPAIILPCFDTIAVYTLIFRRVNTVREFLIY